VYVAGVGAALVRWSGDSRPDIVSTMQGQLDVDPTTRFRQISASPGDFACGVTEDNSLSCWGDNHRNQAIPPTDEKFILVSTSRLAACGLKVRPCVAVNVSLTAANLCNAHRWTRPRLAGACDLA